MSTAGPAARRRDRIDDLVAAADVPLDEIAVLRGVLTGLLTHRPEVRGASAYAIAHGGTIVRLFTRGGWVPILIPAVDRRDAPAVLARLEEALDRAPGFTRDARGARRMAQDVRAEEHPTQEFRFTNGAGGVDTGRNPRAPARSPRNK